jgi:transcriptional regulator GlxA family with amidase domain
MTIRIALAAFDDCFASGVIGALDLFQAANAVNARLHPGSVPVFSVQIVSADGNAVRAASGFRLPVDVSVRDAAPAHAVMIPGLSLIEPEALITAVARNQSLSAWLREQHGQGVWLAASCTGSFLLAEAGLLDGRAATTTTWFAALFEQHYPNVRLEADATVVESERVVCGGGPMTYVDLTLYLIEKFAGRELANLCARYIVLDNRRPARVPEMVRHHAQTHDPLVTKAEKWMRANLRHDLRVSDIAAHVAVSERTLTRRFRKATGASPQTHLQRLRLEAGKALLANSPYRLDQILERIGYRDDGAFRRQFKRYTNLSPREYRRRFGDT